MTKHAWYEVLVPRPGKEGKSNWRRIGTAWDGKDGRGMNIEFDALPLQDKDGRCFVSIRPPLPKDGAAPANEAGLDDHIPF
jgi:hypothetical protein